MGDNVTPWVVKIGTAELPFDPTHISIYTKLFNREIQGLRGTHNMVPTGRFMTFIDLRFVLTGKEVNVASSIRTEANDGVHASSDIGEFARMIAQFRSSFFLPISMIKQSSGLCILDYLINNISPEVPPVTHITGVDVQPVTRITGVEVPPVTRITKAVPASVTASINTADAAVQDTKEALANLKSVLSMYETFAIKQMKGNTQVTLLSPSMDIPNIDTFTTVDDYIREIKTALSNIATNYVKLYPSPPNKYIAETLASSIVNAVAADATAIKNSPSSLDISDAITKLSSAAKAYFTAKASNKPAIEYVQNSTNSAILSPTIQVSLQSIEWSTHDTIKPCIVAKVSFLLFNYDAYLSSIRYYKTIKNPTSDKVMDTTDDIAESDVFEKYYKNWIVASNSLPLNSTEYAILRKNACYIPSMADYETNSGSPNTNIYHNLFQYQIKPISNDAKSLEDVASDLAKKGEMYKWMIENTIDLNDARDKETLMRELILRGAQLGYKLVRSITPTPEELNINLNKSLTGIKCRLQQDSAHLPVQGARHSTQQFYVRPKVYVTLEFTLDANSATDMSYLAELKGLVNTSRSLYNNVNYSRDARLYPIFLKNYVVNLCGSYYFIFEDISVQNIEGSKGMLSVNVTMFDQTMPELDDGKGLNRVEFDIEPGSNTLLQNVIKYIKHPGVDTEIRNMIVGKLHNGVLSGNVWLDWYINNAMPAVTSKDSDYTDITINNVVYKSKYNPDNADDVRSFYSKISDANKQIFGEKPELITDSMDRTLLDLSLVVDIVGYFKYIQPSTPWYANAQLLSKYPSYSEVNETVHYAATPTPDAAALLAISNTLRKDNNPFSLYDISGVTDRVSKIESKARSSISFEIFNTDLIVLNTDGEEYWSTGFLDKATPIPDGILPESIKHSGKDVSSLRHAFTSMVLTSNLLQSGKISKVDYDRMVNDVEIVFRNADGLDTLDDISSLVLSIALTYLLMPDGIDVSATEKATVEAIEAIKTKRKLTQLGVWELLKYAVSNSAFGNLVRDLGLYVDNLKAAMSKAGALERAGLVGGAAWRAARTAIWDLPLTAIKNVIVSIPRMVIGASSLYLHLLAPAATGARVGQRLLTGYRTFRNTKSLSAAAIAIKNMKRFGTVAGRTAVAGAKIGKGLISSTGYGLLLTVPIDIAISAYTVETLPEDFAKLRDDCGEFLHAYYGMPFCMRLLGEDAIDNSVIIKLEQSIRRDPLSYIRLQELVSDLLSLGVNILDTKTTHKPVSAYPDLNLPTYKDLFSVSENDVALVKQRLESISRQIAALHNTTYDSTVAELGVQIANLKLINKDEIANNIGNIAIKFAAQVTQAGFNVTNRSARIDEIYKANNIVEGLREAVRHLRTLRSGYVEELMPSYRECGLEPPFTGDPYMYYLHGKDPAILEPEHMKCRTEDHYVDPCCYIYGAKLTALEVAKDAEPNKPKLGEGGLGVTLTKDTRLAEGDLRATAKDATTIVKSSPAITGVTENRAAIERIDASAKMPVSLEKAHLLASMSTDTTDKVQRTANTDLLAKRTNALANSTITAEAHDRFLGVTTNTIRRAFPAFMVYFIREYRNKFRAAIMSEVFNYAHVADFSVHRDKLRGSVATLTISNPFGVLDNDRFSSFADANKTKDVLTADDIESRFNLSEIMLATGTLVNIRQGYSSNPEELENVFSGKISEISKEGELLILTLQGHESELMNTADIDLDVGLFTGRNYYDWCAQLMSYTTHFGRTFLLNELTELKKQQAIKRKELYTTGIVEPIVSQFITSTFNASRSTENIWTGNAGTTFLDWIMTDDFNLRNRTLLEGIHEISRYIPGAVAHPLPLDFRSTMFLGSPNQFYKYTEKFDKEGQTMAMSNYSVNLSLQDTQNNEPSEIGMNLIKGIHQWPDLLTLPSTGINKENQAPAIKDKNDKLFLLDYLFIGHEVSTGYGYATNKEYIKVITPIATKDFSRKMRFDGATINGQQYSDVVKSVLDADYSEYIQNITIEDKILLSSHLLWEIFAYDVPGIGAVWFSSPPKFMGENITRSQMSRLKEPTRNAKFVDTDGTAVRIANAITDKNMYGSISILLKPLLREDIDDEFLIAIFKARLAMFGLAVKHLKDGDKYIGRAAQQSKTMTKRNSPKLFPGYRPFRQYHTITTEEIVRNEIECTVAEMANEIKLYYPRGGIIERGKMALGLSSEDKWDSRSFSFDILQHGSQKLVRHIREPNAWYMRDAMNIGFRDLSEAMKTMYRGQLTIIGRKDIKPYDIIFIRDQYNVLYGSFEVAEVVHNHTVKEGWVTTITPHLITQSYYIEEATMLACMDVVFSTARVVLDIWMLQGVFSGIKPIASAIGKGTAALANPAIQAVVNQGSRASDYAAAAASAGAKKNIMAIMSAVGNPVGRYIQYSLYNDVLLSGIVESLAYSDIALSALYDPKLYIAPRSAMLGNDAVTDASAATVPPVVTFMNPVIVFPLIKNGHPWIAGLDGIDMNNVYSSTWSLTGALVKRYRNNFNRGLAAYEEDIVTALQVFNQKLNRAAMALSGKI